MKNKFLPEVIKKITKRSKKIITSDELKKIIQAVLDHEYLAPRAYKILYYLKKRGYLLSLKKTIFYIKKPEQQITEQSVIEENYWQILHAHCSQLSWKQWYVWWFKALQLTTMDLSIPENIQIVTHNHQRQEVVVSERTIQFKKYTVKWNTLFDKFKKHTIRQKLQSRWYLLAKKELAVLEILYSFDTFENQYELEYLKKYIKKHKHWDFTVREEILKLWKHHTSINRLYELFTQYQLKIAPDLLEVIRKYWFKL